MMGILARRLSGLFLFAGKCLALASSGDPCRAWHKFQQLRDPPANSPTPHKHKNVGDRRRQRPKEAGLAGC